MYDPPYSYSTDVYNHIAENIAGWVDTRKSFDAADVHCESA
jgi:hypothetical protein